MTYMIKGWEGSGINKNKSCTGWELRWVGVGGVQGLIDNNIWAKEDCIGDKIGFKRSY